MKNRIPTFEEFVNEQKEIKAKENEKSQEDEKTNEAEVKDKESFKEYVFAKLKKEHGDDFDEKKAQEVVDGLAKEVEDGDGDWGVAIGKLNKG